MNVLRRRVISRRVAVARTGESCYSGRNAVLCVPLAARARPARRGRGVPQRSAAARVSKLQGQILAVAPERSEVDIKHQDIKGFMPGMTMPFKVKDAALLRARSPAIW